VEWSNQQKLKSKTNYTRIIGENAGGSTWQGPKTAILTAILFVEKYKKPGSRKIH
jgi:hypothetical protein